jgi:mono/diheme cytochrome c family protein
MIRREILIAILIIMASAAITGCTTQKSRQVDASKKFEITCGVCHGSAGVGGTGIAPALVNNEFIRKSSREEIAATIKNGRNYSQKRYPEFGSIMPPSGYSDEEIGSLVDYLKSLQ